MKWTTKIEYYNEDGVMLQGLTQTMLDKEFQLIKSIKQIYHEKSLVIIYKILKQKARQLELF